MLETSPAAPARRTEMMAASDSFAVDVPLDWEPQPLARAIRTGRRFRWTVVVLGLILGAAAYAGLILGFDYPARHARSRAVAYTLSAGEIAAALGDAGAAAAAITDPGARPEAVTAAVGPLLRLEAASARAGDAADEWLLTLPEPFPATYLADVAAARDRLRSVTDAVDGFTGRLRVIADYRLGVASILDLPELPSAADPIPVAEAHRAIGEALATAVSALGALPDEPLLRRHRDALSALVVWLSEWQAPYVSALQAGDLAGAARLERRAQERIADVSLSLLEPLAAVERWAAEQVTAMARGTAEVRVLSGR